MLNGPFNRRTFMKGGVAATAWSMLPAAAAANTAGKKQLPGVPTPGNLASACISHRFGDLYSTPATQNEWGYVKAAKSATGITAISFPPYACCGDPGTAWSPGYLSTCELFLNGKLLMVTDANETSYVWYPHRIVREARAEGLKFTTTTLMPSKRRAVLQEIVVTNPGTQQRRCTVEFDLRAAVIKKTEAWFVNSPGEADNRISANAAQGYLVFEAAHSKAASVQGFRPVPDGMRSGRVLTFDLTLGPGESRTLRYANAIAGSGAEALAGYNEAQGKFEALMRENEESFTGLMRAAFTPGNSEFSGHLPQLETDDEALWDLYYRGFTNLLFARRTSPDSAYGTTYITLGGRVLPTLSFPWDTSLTSMSLALLDPDPLRQLMETWLAEDMHKHLATDYVSGHAVGPWYAVNDMAILRCAENYLRVTGDFRWLDKTIDGKPVLDRLTDHALYWKQLDRLGHGLADYGKIENLLEVVSTYLHEVAGMNAGNVSGMRFVAQLLDLRGNGVQANQLRAEASALAAQINRKLYIEGKGYWRCGQPDGSFNEVRHCYDLLAVLDNMADDLSTQQKQEMSEFFWNELHTPLWMRALSAGDADATWNIRSDHSAIGAYPSWPPMTAKGLYKTGRSSANVASWVKQLSKAGNQGPFGQAHVIEAVLAPEQGGARKSPEDAPYFNDWCCIAAGSFVDLVVDSIFGAELTLRDGIRVQSRLSDFDVNAKLVNLRHQGKNYRIGAGGAELI